MEYQIEHVELSEQAAAVVRGHVAHDQIGDFLGGVFGEVMGVISTQGLAPAGPPFGRYMPTADGFDIEAGFPTTGPVTPTGRVEASALPGGHTLQILHQGPYDAVAAAYQAAESWLGENGWKSTSAPWEAYLDGPEVAQPRTLVSFPCEPR